MFQIKNKQVDLSESKSHRCSYCVYSLFGTCWLGFESFHPYTKRNPHPNSAWTDSRMWHPVSATVRVRTDFTAWDARASNSNSAPETFRTVSGKVPKRRKIVFISIAINRITLKVESKMSQMVYKAIETTISRADEIKTWYICRNWWYLSSRWHQGKLQQKYYRYCNTIKVFGTYRSGIKIPTQELDVLGFTINSVNMTFSLKKEKKSNLLPSKKKKKTNKKM